MKFIFSEHALEQIKKRNISVKTIESVLENPNRTSVQSDRIVYQAVIQENNKGYLIRIFVNYLVVRHFSETNRQYHKLTKNE